MRQGDHSQHGEIAFTLPVVVEQQVEVDDRVAKEQKLMSKTYAIADLHGRFDLLEMALACIAKCAFSKWHLRALPSAPNLRPHWSR
jgi:hypothetical protein